MASNDGTVDPLSEHYGPALFPRTVIASAGGRMPVDSKDLDSIHRLMNGLRELRSPEKLLSEAERVVKGGAELLESNITQFAESIGLEIAMPEKDKDRPQQRRPCLGLARKRASFSSKAAISEHPVVQPTVDIDLLQDPNDFFDAYERLENAKKEIQKHMGGNLNTKYQLRASLGRRHRLGILGKSYSYKHHYSANPSQNDDVLVPLHEADLINSSSPKNLMSSDSTLSPDIEDGEQTGKQNDDQFIGILDEVLSRNNEDLDGEGALNLLQDRLNIKHLDMDSLIIPEVSNVGRASTSTAGKSLVDHHNDSRFIHKVLTASKSRSPAVPELITQSRINLSTPQTTKSPFSSVALLMKRTLKFSPLNDPYALSPEEVQPTDNSHEQVLMSKDFSMTDLDPCVGISEPVLPDIDDSMVITGANHNLPSQLLDREKGLENANCCDKSNDVPDFYTGEPDNIESSHDTGRGDSNVSVVEDDRMCDSSNRHQASSNKQVHQEATKRNSKRTAEDRIRKAHPMRKSIADGGTSFENGVRRSKRIKMRPLEYWKGERFLYGRVHDSLKLIGVRCLSPGNGDAALKVRPYIFSESSEIKELLDWAARH